MFENMTAITQSVDRWSNMTYVQAYQQWAPIYCENKDLLRLVSIVLKKQKLVDKTMIGNSIEGLIVTEEEHLDVKYAFIPEKLEAQKSDWTPFDIIVYICQLTLSKKTKYTRRATAKGMTFDDLTVGMCGRALRALPSAMREYQLATLMRAAYPDAAFEKTEELDRDYHCDLLMTLNNRQYYHWSFVATKNSIESFKKKFTGYKGGTIAAGYHVICGLNKRPNKYKNWEVEVVELHGWYFYTERYVAEIKRIIDKDIYERYEYFIQRRFSYSIYNGPVLVHNSIEKTFENQEYKEKHPPRDAV